MELRDKVVVVTGGGRGLGRAIAVFLAARGARLALIDLDEAALSVTVERCQEVGSEARAYVGDVANEEQVCALFERIPQELGGLDALINNAGITRDAMLLKAKDGRITKKMSLAQWQQVLDVNLTGSFLCGREAACQMVEAGTSGVIINISSISRHGNMGQTNYSASKAGVAAMAVVWAKELARYGIRVAAIAPGFIATEMVMSMKPEALAKVEGMIPSRRLGTPEEIAQTVAFILENDYITGRCLEIDGGLRI